MSSDIVDTLAQRLGELCQQAGYKIVTAESCTGGGLAEIMTRIPGSSAWFERGLVTYSNEAKQELLGIAQEILDEHGAVSEETATAMAEGALQYSHADLSVAITGIAGPDGGSEEKPVGMVCFAWGDNNTGRIRTTTVRFAGSRLKIRTQACKVALQGLIENLERNRE